MRYRRMPIEIESPEQFGYDRIKYNLTESSVTDAVLGDLDLNLKGLVLAYGDHLGKPELRALLASEGESLAQDDVMLTVGAISALFIVNTVLLNAGDHMIVAYPNYITNVETPRAIGCEVETLELRFEDEWRVDIDRLALMIRPTTKLISLTNPHNPTGSMMTEPELRAVIELVEKHGCYLLLDETYREMSYSGTLPLGASLSPRVISVSSFSKSFGMPGIRLGWLLCRDKSLMQSFLAAKEQILLCGSVVDEEIAYQVLLNKSAFLARINNKIESNLAILTEWIAQQSSMEWVAPRGGVVCFPCLKPELALDVELFYQVLNDTYGTFVGPGHWFEASRRHMRIGFGWCDAPMLQGGLNGITSAIQVTLQRRENR